MPKVFRAVEILTLAIIATLTVGQASVLAGILTGQVTDPNMIGVFDVKIEFFDAETGDQFPVVGNFTDASGNYGILVDDGTYYVEFVTPVLSGGIVPIHYEGISIVGTVVFNVTHPFGVILSGTVRDTLGVPVEGADLNIYDAATGAVEFTPNDNTDILGIYELIIEPGVKNVRFSPPLGSRLAATQVGDRSITTDQVFDTSLVAGFFVTGTARDQLDLQPVRDADMDFDVSGTGRRYPTPGDNTDDNGDYTVTVPPGVYDITIEPDVNDRLVAQRIFSIPINKDTTIDWLLDAGWSLSGTVTGPGGAVPNCDIDVVDRVTLAKLQTPGDKTDDLGFYEVIVPSGSYDIHFQPPVVTRLAPAVQSNINIAADIVVNASVAAGVLVEGTTQSAGGAFVSGVDIDIFDAATGADVLIAGDITNFAGNYAIVLVPGLYDFEFEPPKSRRLVAKRFNGISVTTDQILSVVHDTGLSVSGTIRATGVPVDSVDTDAIHEGTGLATFTPGDLSDALGQYEIIIGFEPHTLAFFPAIATGLATHVVTGVNPGADLVLDVDLVSGHRLSGVVTGAGAVPISGATLRAESGGHWVPTAGAPSDAGGAYETILPTGTYDLQYSPPPGIGLADTILTGIVINGDLTIDVTLPGGGLPCTCDCQGDEKCDGLPNVFDVVFCVGEAFRSEPYTPDPNPSCVLVALNDLNFDGQVNVFDVVFIVNMAFRSGSRANNVCDPCTGIGPLSCPF